jgi:hypothetical protein
MTAGATAGSPEAVEVGEPESNDPAARQGGSPRAEGESIALGGLYDQEFHINTQANK